jgi:type III secretory pathway lipoprotein EscJ
MVCVLACACEARPSAHPSRAHVDKQAMFGSASLVPTREGERARRELAIAGELQQALAQLELGPAHVDVELGDPTTVIMIARYREDRSVSEAETAAIELAHAMIPELQPANLHLWLQPASAEQPAPEPHSRTWLLMLACLGLGLSLGIGGERLRTQ